LIRVWRIATDAPGYTADDLTGTGAKLSGGRWNRPGSAMIYSASNISLAVLETFVHLKAGGLPLNRYLVELAIPDEVWERATSLLPPATGWDAIPAGKVSLDEGDRWLKANTSALLIGALGDRRRRVQRADQPHASGHPKNQCPQGAQMGL
jgi:RES domain-containing protein